ncbi:hypothetical protein SDC9_194147 [bioreactor metagenome]|uniref:Uncharacterized protein n=1 Tax=bioreactor metagenome TaxID=1076179 RepID=A0A645I5H1_9ZZZZ
MFVDIFTFESLDCFIMDTSPIHTSDSCVNVTGIEEE